MTERTQNSSTVKPAPRVPWNKGKLVGPKAPLQPSHVWSIRTKLQIDEKKRDLALFNLAIDSKLRGCDVVAIRVEDVAPGGYAMDRATVRQRKTGRPVRYASGEDRRSGCLPVPGQQVVDAFGGVVVDTGEDVGEPGPSVNVVEFASLNQRVDGGSAATAAIGTCKGPVAATDSDTAHGSLGGVVRQADATVFEEARKGSPPFQVIVDCLRGRALG